MVATVIDLPDELRQHIEELARQTGRAKADLLSEAIATFMRTRRVPRPRSDGVMDDPELAARAIDEWLAASWHPE